MERNRIASLWIGERLSFLDLLCLKAFDDIGQRVTLYSYNPIQNMPPFAIAANANEIYETQETLRQKVGSGILRGSPALHADIFRMHLLKKTDFIWVDTDVYPLRTLETQNGFLFGGVGKTIMNSVLALPKQSQTLSQLIKFASKNDEFPPWWDEKMRKDHLSKNLPVQPEFFPWGTYGPDALRYFMNLNGEVKYSSSSEVLYPIKARHKAALLNKSDIQIPTNSMSIHLYSTNLRALIRRNYGGKIPVDSFLHKLCRKCGIDPSDAPV